MSALLEHSVYVFGGVASACNTASLAELLEDTEYTTVSRRPTVRGNTKGEGEAAAASGGETESASSVSCQLGDTWRLVWLEDLALPSSLSHAEALEAGAAWQHLSFIPGQHAPLSKPRPAVGSGTGAGVGLGLLRWWMSGWAALRGLGGGTGAADSGHPSPRSMPALAPVGQASSSDFAGAGVAGVAEAQLLLWGGALCTPGCVCRDDGWLLRVAPVAVAEEEEACSAGRDSGSGSHTGELRAGAFCNPDADAYSEGIGWVRVAPQPRRLRLNAVEATQIFGLSPPSHVNREDVAVDVDTPPARYRHSLTPVVDAVTRAAAARWALEVSLIGDADNGTITSADAKALLTDIAHAPFGYGAAVLFGGESYAPSTYFDDTWLWLPVEDYETIITYSEESGASQSQAAPLPLRREAKPPSSLPPSHGLRLTWQLALAVALAVLAAVGLLRCWPQQLKSLLLRTTYLRHARRMNSDAVLPGASPTALPSLDHEETDAHATRGTRRKHKAAGV
jgi:hypothetical protein